jgi:hypothetical protein
MMNGWLALDRLAAERGDGLNPALRDLLDARAAIGGSSVNVVDIAPMRGDTLGQSGPVPAGKVVGPLPKNVIRFRPRTV